MVEEKEIKKEEIKEKENEEGCLDIYSPKEDSFLLKKAILEEELKGKKCLDMGAGSGIQAEAMFEAGAEEVTSVDINPKVIAELKKKTHKMLDSCWTRLESDLFVNVDKEKFDFIAFNPPYVPSDEIKWKDTDGGEKGREITDKFIEQFPSHLNPKGVLLLLITSLNDEKEVIELIESKGFEVECVERQKLFFEELIILRITHKQG